MQWPRHQCERLTASYRKLLLQVIESPLLHFDLVFVKRKIIYINKLTGYNASHSFIFLRDSVLIHNTLQLKEVALSFLT